METSRPGINLIKLQGGPEWVAANNWNDNLQSIRREAAVVNGHGVACDQSWLFATYASKKEMVRVFRTCSSPLDDLSVAISHL